MPVVPTGTVLQWWTVLFGGWAGGVTLIDIRWPMDAAADADVAAAALLLVSHQPTQPNLPTLLAHCLLIYD
jgi:hypothetical protein